MKNAIDAAVQIQAQRNHDGTGTGTLAASGGTANRAYFSQYFYDNLDRLSASVDVGTFGGTNFASGGVGGTNTFSSVPARSDTVLINSYVYDSGGRVKDVTDPRGLVGRTVYDLAGRVTDTYENYTTGSPTGDTNRRTGYTYDGSDHVLTMKAYDPTGPTQTTTFQYGVTPSNGGAFYSNELLLQIVHPDGTTGMAGSGSSFLDQYKYNAQGEVTEYQDRNQSLHRYAYDDLGRLRADRVVTVGTGAANGVCSNEGNSSGRKAPCLSQSQ